MAAGCTRGDADDCQGLAVEGQSRELFECAVHGWQAECDAASARSCLQLGEVYSATYYLPSIRPFAADPRRASELYARGTALYQQACDRGDTARCHDMAFQPAILSHDPARGRATLVRLCDGGDGVSCAEAGSYVVGDPAERPELWERGCYAPRPWGLACKMLADLPESAKRKAELEQRACQLDPRTCPHPVVQPPP